MKPNPKFRNQPKQFWANVRTISQQVGYTQRGQGQVKIPTIKEIKDAFIRLGLKTSHIADEDDSLTPMGKDLRDYFDYRANILNTFVKPRLMDASKAKQEFKKLYSKLSPKCPIPKNKQKGKKKAPAYMTAIINMIIEANAGEFTCNFDPLELTTVTRNGFPIRTLSRRIDGAFPSIVNPIAIWEIKEYYYTTTFGSRVADGVYETLLDGMELEELQDHENIEVLHYLMIDGFL
jgi:hypothetical protein